jgi:hypothetical protein
MTTPDSSIACTLTDSELRERRRGLLSTIGQSVQETVAREQGFACRFPAEMFDQLARLVVLERQCCAFLRFTITAEPEIGPVWLEITGPSQAQVFLASFWG